MTTDTIANVASYSGILPVISVVLSCGATQLSVGTLLDTGSQQTFIGAQVLDNSKFQIERSEVLCVKGFGGPEIREQCDIIKFSTCLPSENFAMDTIVTSKMNQIIVDKSKYMSDELVVNTIFPTTLI